MRTHNLTLYDLVQHGVPVGLCWRTGWKGTGKMKQFCYTFNFRWFAIYNKSLIKDSAACRLNDALEWSVHFNYWLSVHKLTCDFNLQLHPCITTQPEHSPHSPTSANSFATFHIVKKLGFPFVSPSEWLKCGRFWLLILKKTTLDSITTGVK